MGPIWPWWRVMASAHREGLDWPDDLAVLGHPLDAAHCSFEFGRVCVRWHWNVDLHVVGRGTSFELAFRLGRETSRSSLTRQSTWAGHWSGTSDSYREELSRDCPAQRPNMQRRGLTLKIITSISQRLVCILIPSWDSNAIHQRVAYLDHVLDPAVGVLLNDRFNPDQRLYLSHYKIKSHLIYTTKQDMPSSKSLGLKYFKTLSLNEWNSAKSNIWHSRHLVAKGCCYHLKQ